jgi:hypothetical protein
LGIFFLFLSLGGFAIELQDQHHHYSYSVEDIDEIEEEETNEDDSRWNLGTFGYHGSYSEIHQKHLDSNLSLTRFSGAVHKAESGKHRCILFHQLKWDSVL